MAEQDKYFLEQSEVGKRLREQGITPRGNFAPTPSQRDRVMSALLAFQQGAQAAQKVAPQGDAFGSFVAGAAGGIGAPSAQDLANKQAQDAAAAGMAQFEATPIEQVSPDIAERFGIHGVPLGLVNKLSPFLQKHDDMEKQLALIQARGTESRKNIEFAAEFRNKTIWHNLGTRIVRQVIDAKGKVLESMDMGLTGSVANQVAKITGEIEGAKSNIDDLMALADNVITADKPKDMSDLRGLFGQIRQGVSLKIGEKTGTNLEAVRLIRGLDSALARFSRAVGEVGVLTDQDLLRVKRAMPDVWDNKESFKQGLLFMQEQMDNIMTEKIAAYNATQGSGQQPAKPSASKPKKSLADLLKESGL